MNTSFNYDDLLLLNSFLRDKVGIDSNSMQWDNTIANYIKNVNAKFINPRIIIYLNNAGWNHLKSKYPKLFLDKRNSFNVYEIILVENNTSLWMEELLFSQAKNIKIVKEWRTDEKTERVALQERNDETLTHTFNFFYCYNRDEAIRKKIASY